MTSYLARTLIRWRQATALTRLIWRALLYGIASATLAGLVIGLAHLMETRVAYRGSSAVWLINFVSTGLTYGLVAAPVFALVMTLLARWLYHENEDAIRFKLAMGVVTLIGVGVSAPYLAVLVALNSLFSGKIAPVMSALFLMWGFGVYLSQIIARQYIAEFSPRKRKGKPGWRGLLSAAGDPIDGG